MWRPFASSFVEHSLDSFIVRHEKNKSTSVYTAKPKRNTSPFQLSNEDLEKRLVMFKNLKQKVKMQRELIKKNDSVYQERIDLQLKYKRKAKVLQMISLSNIQKNKSLNTETDQGKGNSTTRNYVKNIKSETPKSFGLPPIHRGSIIE